MKGSKSNESGATEIQIQNIIVAYTSKQYQKIGKIAHTFKLLYSTMKNCLFGVFSQVQIAKPNRIYQMQKKKYSYNGLHVLQLLNSLFSSKMVLEIAEEICQKYMFLALQVLSRFLGLYLINYK